MWKNLTLCLLLIWSTNALSEDDVARGTAVAREMDASNSGWGDQSSTARMILRNAQQQESVRKLRIFTLEGDEDGDKSVTYFDEPADVEGTAMLTHTHKTGNDDQWLYLPALKRVKRISSTNQAGPFMGSEFAYEDLSAPELEKFTYRYLRDETLDGIDCAVIARYPVSEYSGYSRQEVWVDKKRMIPLKIEFFDRRQAMAKVLELRKYKQYEVGVWRSHEMYMKNLNTGKSTTLDWLSYEFGNNFHEREFHPASLGRVQ